MLIQEAAAVTPSLWSAWVLPIGAGICLSAACGLRTFVPLLCVALASHFGVFSLDDKYAWLASTAGLVALGSAAVLEVGGYYIPVVDHLLDVIATPLSMVAGTLVMLTSIGADPGVPGWLLALLIGGGVSGAVQLTTVKARAVSTGTTAGFGNPIVATAELIGASVLSLLAILLPLLALAVAIALLFGVWRAWRWVRARRVRRGSVQVS
jgi:hypothetical protein